MLLVILAMNLGVFTLYSHTLMPGLRQLSDSQFVHAFQSIDRHIINPVFMLQFFSPLLLFGLLGAYALTQQSASIGTLAIGFVCYLAVITVTVTINVPLNDGIKAVPTNAPSEKLAKARIAFNEPRWKTANAVRGLLCLAAIITTTFALLGI